MAKGKARMTTIRMQQVEALFASLSEEDRLVVISFIELETSSVMSEPMSASRIPRYQGFPRLIRDRGRKA